MCYSDCLPLVLLLLLLLLVLKLMLDIDLFCLRPFSTTFKEILKMFACTRWHRFCALVYTYNTTYIATYAISKFSSAHIYSAWFLAVCYAVSLSVSLSAVSTLWLQSQTNACVWIYFFSSCQHKFSCSIFIVIISLNFLDFVCYISSRYLLLIALALAHNIGACCYSVFGVCVYVCVCDTLIKTN